LPEDVSLLDYIKDHLDELEASINRRFAALETMMKTGVEAHHREHSQLDTQKARDEADVNRRLEAMNELRSQINSERGLYVTRPLLDSQLEALHRQNQDNRTRLEELSRQLADIQGRFWMAGTALTFLSVLINVMLKLFIK